MIKRLLVANRGEIACRIFQTCERLEIEAHAVYSDADAHSKHVRAADRAERIGTEAPADSYLNADAVIEAARQMNSEAIHPGYGFLSEDSDFARRVVKEGLIWIGPDPATMDAMSEKIAARELMTRAGVPIVPGTTQAVSDLEVAKSEAERIGYPVMVKASAGGGGIGMTIVRSAEELDTAFFGARTKAERFFANGAVYLEKYVRSARHVEVQFLGLNSGKIVVVGDRDCSVQRRHQKVLEEAPCPGLGTGERTFLHETARVAAAKVDYRGAGTVEMMLDLDDRNMYFLEMNTRLQVEHPVTEMVTGIDLVEAQIRIAQGDELDGEIDDNATPQGHALEFRVYAEDPIRFFPGPGLITEWEQPEGAGIRVDGGYESGDSVSTFYDPLMAKLCVHASDRDGAIERLKEAASRFRISGPKNNLPLVERIAGDHRFAAMTHDTRLLDQSGR